MKNRTASRANATANTMVAGRLTRAVRWQRLLHTAVTEGEASGCGADVFTEDAGVFVGDPFVTLPGAAGGVGVGRLVSAGPGEGAGVDFDEGELGAGPGEGLLTGDGVGDGVGDGAGGVGDGAGFVA